MTGGVVGQKLCWPRSCVFRVSVTAVVLTVGQLVSAPSCRALIVGGGGRATTDCLVVFDTAANLPSAKPRHVKCVDGDPTCDADGMVNGVCEIPVTVCANSTALSKCSLAGVESITVDHALDNGDKRFDPQFQALQGQIDNGIQLPSSTADECANPTNFHVPINGPVGNNHCHPARKRIRITTQSEAIDGKFYTDKDTLKLICKPSPDNGCDPQVLFTGTFDRIQKQIFNQSCAVSSCHDSQTKSADLLLETGAAYTNLINVAPTTPPALAAGWKRVTVLSPTIGDPDTSFLYHKITGDLPDATYGERMPRGQRKLHRTLREVIRLWIENGAPDTGWVPGTF